VWVKLLAGSKRWLILPPNTVHRDRGRGGDYGNNSVDSENKSNIRRNLEEEMLGKSAGEVIQWAVRQKVPLIDFVQRPGDIVFIPADCMHAVLNLEDSLAYAENFIVPMEATTAVGTNAKSARMGNSKDARTRRLWATAATRRFLQSLPAKEGMFQRLKNMIPGYV